VIAGRREEHLRLVLQAAERLAVDDAIAIALERGPDLVFGLRPEAPARVGASRGLRREALALTLLELLSEVRQLVISFRKLVPLARRLTPNTSASVCPRSANVVLVPRSAPTRTWQPAIISGTYSRA